MAANRYAYQGKVTFTFEHYNHDVSNFVQTVNPIVMLHNIHISIEVALLYFSATLYNNDNQNLDTFEIKPDRKLLH